MQNTSNYNLNIVEGTDIVNIPVQLNPNFQTIDAEMFKNKQGSTGTATEVVTGTVHAIVRSNTDADVFRYTATGNWASGDTMTVDGGAVTVHLTDGTAPGAGAYVIGAEVVAVINGTLVTLISSSAAVDPGVTSFNSRTGAVTPTASDYDASMIDYDNTSSGLVATDTQSAIDEIVGSSGLVWSQSGVTTYPATTITINDIKATDKLIFMFEFVGGSTAYSTTVMCSPGDTVIGQFFDITGSGQVSVAGRNAVTSLVGSTLSVAFSDAYYKEVTNYGVTPTAVTNNTYQIPTAIYKLR